MIYIIIIINYNIIAIYITVMGARTNIVNVWSVALYV